MTFADIRRTRYLHTYTIYTCSSTIQLGGRGGHPPRADGRPPQVPLPTGAAALPLAVRTLY